MAKREVSMQSYFEQIEAQLGPGYPQTCPGEDVKWVRIEDGKAVKMNAKQLQLLIRHWRKNPHF